jgi:sensory box sensor/GGDEF/EAL domain protein
LAPEHGDNFMTLYQKADEAMYARKRNGRHGFRIYGE